MTGSLDFWFGKVYKDSATKSLNKPEHTRWELLSHASAAEGGIEANLLKIASECSITEDDCKQIGLFRQAYQQLRKVIRDDNSISWKRLLESKRILIFLVYQILFLTVLPQIFEPSFRPENRRQ